MFRLLIICCLALFVALSAASKSPDSSRADTLAEKDDSLRAQQDSMKVRLLVIRTLLVERMEVAETGDIATDSMETTDTTATTDTLYAQRDSADGQ
ncbi:MAG: hypothetical protein KOO63_05490 [Bacteroidales bacterium]|nr:hypothetical protein [Candidatus Latescibacterota bacterium]